LVLDDQPVLLMSDSNRTSLCVQAASTDSAFVQFQPLPPDGWKLVDLHLLPIGALLLQVHTEREAARVVRLDSDARIQSTGQELKGDNWMWVSSARGAPVVWRHHYDKDYRLERTDVALSKDGAWRTLNVRAPAPPAPGHREWPSFDYLEWARHPGKAVLIEGASDLVMFRGVDHGEWGGGAYFATLGADSVWRGAATRAVQSYAAREDRLCYCTGYAHLGTNEGHLVCIEGAFSVVADWSGSDRPERLGARFAGMNLGRKAEAVCGVPEEPVAVLTNHREGKRIREVLCEGMGCRFVGEPVFWPGCHQPAHASCQSTKFGYLVQCSGEAALVGRQGVRQLWPTTSN
jgi:hypothetical protein